MGRPHRASEGGFVYHVLNRGNAGMTVFDDQGDFDAFEKVLAEAVERTDTRLLAYCLLPNHWHLLVWPRKKGELSQFVRWLTLTHTQRWHAHRPDVGNGHVYQGRFKSFPVQEDEHFYAVARHVERNALRANLVPRAEAWPWCSLYRWLRGTADDKPVLASWPLRRKSGWVEWVNAPPNEAELTAIRRSVERGNPYGSESWNERTIRRLGLELTIRPRGRPRKEPAAHQSGS
ncbi:MAG TPA: transposase [Pirellulales bacterium]|nr:transposase [Pirellulales bacterium]